MAIVHIPSLSRKLTHGQDSVEVPGRTVGEVLRNLDQRFPGLAAQFLDGEELRESVAVAVDDEMATAGLLEPVGERSVVHLLPALSGGLR